MRARRQYFYIGGSSTNGLPPKPLCMKSVAILQHETSQGPGVLLDHLRQRGISFELIAPCDERLIYRTAPE